MRVTDLGLSIALSNILETDQTQMSTLGVRVRSRTGRHPAVRRSGGDVAHAERSGAARAGRSG